MSLDVSPNVVNPNDVDNPQTKATNQQYIVPLTG